MLGQVSVEPTVTPVLNNGGWVYNAAVLLTLLALALALLIVFGYMRLAPRFQTDEQTRKAVRVPRVQPGQEVRRPVKVISAPVVVQPPVVATASANVAAQATATLAAPAAAPAPASAPAPVAAASAAPLAGPVAPEAAPSTAPPSAVPATSPPPAAPDAEASAAEPSAAAAPAPAAGTGEHRNVSLDQETFDRVLAELIEKGTDRRVAEGQARRAAMIAARKKAEG